MKGYAWKGMGWLTSGCRLAGVDVANNDDVDMNFFFTAVRTTRQLMFLVQGAHRKTECSALL